MSTVLTVSTQPYSDQKPGTSGLRKKVAVFQQPNYVANFVQSVLNLIPEPESSTLVVGGDGRFFNDEAIQVIVRLAAGNGFGRVIVGRDGILSTPAASAVIRSRGAEGGLILSASHNPAGEHGDFGIKFNAGNGGPATEALTAEIVAQAATITCFYTAPNEVKVDLSKLGESVVGSTVVEVIDPVALYAELMETLFDFESIRALLRSAQFAMRFDAMHAVTGPYAAEILVSRLGASPETLMNCVPSPDFGGGHPDPNLVHAKQLVDMVNGSLDIQFGAASDGDGDRNMVLGKGCYVNPCDSLAIMTANAQLLPGYAHGLAGVARSMPTSRAVDRVAARLGIDCFETPTGWKFFGSLLDAGKITLCGEESFGSGSNHVREKDGLWAVLFWLNLIAIRGQSVGTILENHWTEFGRDFFTRHDYEGIDSARAEQLMAELDAKLANLAGQDYAGFRVIQADQFAYKDPVDGSVSEGQGYRILLEDQARIVIRLSGTGTSGATLRLYYDQYSSDPATYSLCPQHFLAPLFKVAEQILGLSARIDRQAPDVIT